jgi:hypothetical protein
LQTERKERTVAETDGLLLKRKSEGLLRARWLVNLTVVLAVLIEACPTEADFASRAILSRGFLGWLMVKMISLTIILLPLLIYVILNGWKALRCVIGRLTVVGAIITIAIMLETQQLFSLLLGH